MCKGIRHKIHKTIWRGRGCRLKCDFIPKSLWQRHCPACALQRYNADIYEIKLPPMRVIFSGLVYMNNEWCKLKVAIHCLPALYRVPLVANYIRVKCACEGQFQYAVSFNPEVHAIGMRRKMLRSCEDTLGPHQFDGAILFLPKRLPEEVGFNDQWCRDFSKLLLIHSYVS